MIKHKRTIEVVERSRLSALLGIIVTITLLLAFWVPSVSFLSLLLAYGLFFITLRVIARYHKRRKAPARTDLPALPGHWPKVSILVPAHNEESVIGKTIENLLKLDYPSYEVLVIDDRSTDDTGNILRQLKSSTASNRFSYFSRLNGDRPGKAAVLNDAFPQSQGDILCIFDADAIVEPDFLIRLIPYFTEGVGAIQARKVLLNPHQNWLTLCQRYEYLLDAYLQSQRDSLQGAVELRGSGMLLRREALETLDGWNEASLTEDLDFCTRMHAAGWDIRYVPQVQLWEEGLTSLAPLLRQRLRWTEGSIIRYLENAGGLLLNHRVAFRTKLDMMQFVFEFLAPVWLLAENLLLISRWAAGQLSGVPVLFSSSALLVLSAYFFWATYQGITRFGPASFRQALKGTILTYLYLSLLWLPIVFVLIGRILIRRERNLAWEKTPHYGVAIE